MSHTILVRCPTTLGQITRDRGTHIVFVRLSHLLSHYLTLVPAMGYGSTGTMSHEKHPMRL